MPRAWAGLLHQLRSGSAPPAWHVPWHDTVLTNHGETRCSNANLPVALQQGRRGQSRVLLYSQRAGLERVGVKAIPKCKAVICMIPHRTVI